MGRPQPGPRALQHHRSYAPPPAVTVRRQPASSIAIGPSVSTCRSTLQPTLARWTLIVTAATFRAVRSIRFSRGMLGTGPQVRYWRVEESGVGTLPPVDGPAPNCIGLRI